MDVVEHKEFDEEVNKVVDEGPRRQAPAFSGILIPGFSGRDFCKIPGSRDFPGRDLPHIFIPGFLEIVRDFSGYFCLIRLVINLNIFHEQESPTNIFFPSEKQTS